MASSRGGDLSSSSSTSSLEELSSQPSRSSITSPSRDKTIDTTDRPGPEMKKNNESNPFSFKHFLRKASQTNYRNAGARPKIYSPIINNTDLGNSSIDTDNVYTGRNPTELPDFVQDHLVIEQCYLNNDGAVSPTIPDVENLPDFAINSIGIESRIRPHRINDTNLNSSENNNNNNNNNCGDLTFDLTGSLAKRPHDFSNITQMERRHNGSSDNSKSIRSFPLDLPIQESSVNLNSQTHDANLPKSLPDFLSDGPIRNRVAPSQQESSTISNSNEQPLDRRLMLEIDQLRHDLEMTRRQNHEQYRRIQFLEAELSTRRAVDHQETAHLEKAMEQVEDNLKRSTRRAVNAESAVTNLKQEVKALKLNISVLRSENRELKDSLGAGYNDPKPVNNEKKIQRFASDIRDAASSAECLLRQLMSGVDNLKVVASAMENFDRIEDRTKDYLFDLNDDDVDDDDAAGPAL